MSLDEQATTGTILFTATVVVMWMGAYDHRIVLREAPAAGGFRVSALARIVGTCYRGAHLNREGTMGCDIHMIVQRKKKWDSGNDYWSTQLPPAWWPRDDWKAKWIAELTAKLPDAGSAQTLASQLSYWYDGRNYDLFGILADVRNGSGFAGIKTLDTGWPSIAPNRGLPEGLDKDPDETGWLGDHSFTWMTLAEVLAYQWETTTRTQYGVVTLEQFLARDPNATGFPYTDWSGEVWGGGSVTMTADEVRAKLAAGEDPNPDGVRLYVRDTWPITAAQASGYFHETTLPALVRQAAEWGVSHEDVRLVMGFDS